MANPFFYGGKITNPADFIGREVEMRKVFSGLNKFSAGQAQHYSIVGERRMGKSSLLYHLTQVYSHHNNLKKHEMYRFIYLDLDDPHCHKMLDLLGYILKSLKVNGPARPSLTDFYDRIVELHRKGICPVLCVDEFEHLALKKSEFPDLFFEALRSLGENSHIAFITASKKPLSELLTTADLTSNFHNIFVHLPLGEFKAEEARRLLDRNTARPFTGDEQTRLFNLAGYHPAKLQIAASLLYEAKDGSKVSWKAVQADFKTRWIQVQSSAPSKPGARKDSNFLVAIGKTVLGLRKEPKEISNSSAVLVGVLLIILVLVILALLVLLLTGAFSWTSMLKICYLFKFCPLATPSPELPAIPNP